MAKSEDWSTEKAKLQDLKEQQLADRVQLQAEILSGELIPRVLISKTASQIFANYRVTVLVADDTLGEMISIFLGIKSEAFIVRKIMSEVAYKMINEIVKDVENYVKTEL